MPIKAVMRSIGRARARARAVLQAALALALALYAARALLGVGGDAVRTLFATWIHNALMVAAAGICMWRALGTSDDRTERAGWLCLTLAMATYAAGEVAWAAFYADLEEAPYPSVSDVLWLAFYPASYAGLVLLFRARVRRFDPSLWLDGLIGAFAVTGIGAAAVFPAVLAETGGSAAAVATTLAYPLGDAVLICFVLSVFALMAWRPDRGWLLLGAGLAVNAVADSLYSYQSATGTFVEGSLTDVLFPAAALALAFSAFQPARRRDVRVEGLRVLAFPAVFSLAALGLTGYAFFEGVDPLAEGCALATSLLVLARLGLSLKEQLRMLQRARLDAITDPLTGLGNRRRLMDDLPVELPHATLESPRAVVVFDLDGFKVYNDTFGHLAGDVLLARLGRNLARAVEPWGRAYRLGGDEFCAIVKAGLQDVEGIAAAGSGALAEHGEGFEIGCSHGSVLVPLDTKEPATALQIADERMYAQKQRRPSSPGRQTRDVLLGLLREREPDLHEHTSGVARLAIRVGKRLGIRSDELDEVARAAELHDIGKVAMPDAILSKPGPLDPDEREFVEHHTIIGERILSAAPALRPVAAIVRSTHERYDGYGYPDRLAGDDIPLGARIVAVCDAYDAMIVERPYRTAMSAESAREALTRESGGRFDPAVVAAFLTELESPESGVPVTARGSN
jgi:two-component system cell cycle response regulator